MLLDRLRRVSFVPFFPFIRMTAIVVGPLVALLVGVAAPRKCGAQAAQGNAAQGNAAQGNAAQGNDWSALAHDAQAAQAAGHLKEAADLFARARKLVPENIVPLRGACDVALSMQRAGQLVSSREPCHRAFLIGAKPEDMYREVASVMHEPTAPSLDTTVLEAFAADAAVRRGAGEQWGYLARCEIGRRLGLADVLEGCLADLQRIAPNSPETKEMLAEATPHSHFWIWALRLMLVLVPLATCAHLLMVRFRTRRAQPLMASKAAAVIFVLAALSGLAGSARAALVERNGHPELDNDQLSIFPIDDANPEGTVPSVAQQNEKPLQFGYYLQDLAAKVERAKKNNDVPAQIRYYRAITKAAPNSPYGPRKLCEVLESSGDIDGAIVACRTATVIEGTTVGDFRRLIDVILAKPGSLASDLQNEVYAAIDHIQAEAQLLGSVPEMLRCNAAVRFQDWSTLKTCSDRLVRAAPNDAKTVSFQWALAVHERDKQKAEVLVDRARTLGMEPAGIKRMEATNRAMGRTALVRLLVTLAIISLAVIVWRMGGKKLLPRRNASA